MKIPPDSPLEPLLDEVLAGAEIGALRAATLELTVELARRRRRSRVRNRMLVALMMPLLAGAVGMLWPRRPDAPANLGAFSIVHTGPTQPGMLVPLLNRSSSLKNSQASYRVVTTDSVRPGYRILSDDALLAMFPNRPVGLITDFAGQRHLVFLDASGPSSPGE